MFPIRDYEDGVDRCPFCTWELEDGMCNRCGLPIDEDGGGQWEFSDIASEHPSIMGGHDIVIEEDYDVEDDFIDDEDEEGDWEAYDPQMQYAEDMGWGQPFTIQRMLGGHPPSRRVNRGSASHSAAGSRSRYSASVVESVLEEEDEDEDEDSSMSGFVVDDDQPVDYSRESTPMSRSPSQSSRFPESIAEEDEEEEDDVPIAPARRRMQSTQSSTPAITNSRSQQAASQINRRRRVLSETPSTESTSSQSAAAEDDEDDEPPIAAASRRRRRPLSQEEEPSRRVRQRARGNSIPAESGSDPWGYRPLGTPQIGDGEDEQSDGGRTEVGWEPITNPNTRLRDTNSLTPTADRPSTPPHPQRPASRNSFPLGSRGLRRRSSVVSVVHYEDNDADGESDTQQANATAQPALQNRTSRARLRNVPSQQAINRSLAPSHIAENEDTDSGDTETSPQAGRRGPAIQHRDPNPYIRMLLAEHRTEVQSSEPEGPVYAEFEHLRNINRTPVARPRTSNRNRNSAAGQPASQAAVAQTTGTPVRSIQQQVYSPSRFRVAPEAMRSGNIVGGISRQMAGMQNSPRNSISGPSGAQMRWNPGTDPVALRGDVIHRQHNSGLSAEHQLHPNNVALLRSMQNATPRNNASTPLSRQQIVGGPPQSPRMPQFNEQIERPVSRISTRGGYLVQHGPARPPSNTNRPPSTGGSRRSSLTRSPFTAPQMVPSSVGLQNARAFQTNNPFFRAQPTRQPPQPSRQASNRQLRPEPSNQTLRRERSRTQFRVAATGEVLVPTIDSRYGGEPTSPQMSRLVPSASRLQLRPQGSRNFQRVHNHRDPGLSQYQQSAAMPIPQPPARTSPSGSSTLSEDERVRRATELVQRRMQELAQQQRASPAATARMSAAAMQQRIDERLAANMGRGSTNAAAIAQRAGGQAAQPHMSTNSAAASNVQTQDTANNARAATINRPTGPAPAPVPPTTFRQTPPTLPAAPTRMPNTQSQAVRSSVEQGNGRSQIPGMAQGVTAITTGGDIRRN